MVSRWDSTTSCKPATGSRSTRSSKAWTAPPGPHCAQNPGPYPRFILDVNLGKLAKRMRLLGFDSLYRNDNRDQELVQIAVNEQRIILTRDRRPLFIKQVSHGYWVRAVDADSQIDEVLRRYRLYGFIQPLVRCLVCKGMLAPVAKAEILDRLEPKTRLYYEVFHRCADCQRIYWEGSHITDMRRRYASLLPAAK